MVHKDVNIELVVKTLKIETPGHLSLAFEHPRNFTYEAGDWIDIEFRDAVYRGGKTYSLASSPTEPDLFITFREGISPLKKALAAAKPGDALRIVQYGNDYGFHLRDNRSSVLIAGGIGIAPFRSMLKGMADQHDKHSVRLIYMHKSDDFIFHKELEEWQSQLANLQIDYVVTENMKRKDREKLLRQISGDQAQQYYIAGPEGMVASTRMHLLSNGIDKRHIKVDSFGGY